MKRNMFICILIVIFFAVLNQANAQELNAPSIVIENKIGRITILYADSAVSSVVFYNLFKDMYEKDNDLYQHNLNDPDGIEEFIIDLFIELHNDFIDCYEDPEEENTVVMGFIDEDQVTEFQVYILYTGVVVESMYINYVFIHNTVNDEKTLFSSLED